MRNYIYVSGRKVERLSAALPRRPLARLRELNLKAGPVGAGFSLADAPKETIIAAVAEVEQEIQSKYRVRWFGDPDLSSGHWFMAEDLNMAYGVHHVREASGPGAAVFAAEEDNIQMLLSGSAEYLLDRRADPIDFGDSMSDPQAIYRLLHDLGDESPPQHPAAPPQGLVDSDDYSISNALHVLGSYGWQPMNFLAQAIRVTKTRDGNVRNVVGTPLWVAWAVPE